MTTHLCIKSRYQGISWSMNQSTTVLYSQHFLIWFPNAIRMGHIVNRAYQCLKNVQANLYLNLMTSDRRFLKVRSFSRDLVRYSGGGGWCVDKDCKWRLHHVLMTLLLINEEQGGEGIWHNNNAGHMPKCGKFLYLPSWVLLHSNANHLYEILTDVWNHFTYEFILTLLTIKKEGFLSHLKY